MREKVERILEEHKKEQGQRVRELFSWHIFDTYSRETLLYQGLYTETEGICILSDIIENRITKGF